MSVKRRTSGKPDEQLVKENTKLREQVGKLTLELFSAHMYITAKINKEEKLKTHIADLQRKCAKHNEYKALDEQYTTWLKQQYKNTGHTLPVYNKNNEAKIYNEPPAVSKTFLTVITNLQIDEGIHGHD